MLNSLRTWLAELASPSSDAGSEQGSLNQDGRRTGDDLQFDIIHPGSDSLVRHAKQDGEQVTLSGVGYGRILKFLGQTSSPKASEARGNFQPHNWDPEGAEAPDKYGTGSSLVGDVLKYFCLGYVYPYSATSSIPTAWR
ncbi:hypothetical protein CIHG_02152 [Coccidioides immitis H538.4]|uniref:Uncharacterized protein n=1 Tax=Coccidioides immitis H538.4 TaxID=396776 RepID=A0A0J8RI96_COCIT|nr:hypothetical protein CIHG_02152 [Coccidioides immitis H538.4]